MSHGAGRQQPLPAPMGALQLNGAIDLACLRPKGSSLYSLPFITTLGHLQKGTTLNEVAL